MALRISEFFGFQPLDPAGVPYSSSKTCPFVEDKCIKPRHGTCSLELSNGQPIVCCPNRLYAQNYKILSDIAIEIFGPNSKLVSPAEAKRLKNQNLLGGNHVVTFGRYWGGELHLPTPKSKSGKTKGKYYVDWILAHVDKNGEVTEFTAVEVQTIDTTGNYSDQVQSYFNGVDFTDKQGRNPGFSNANMNWENVSKRILPQIIYKGHVLRGEARCKKGLFFVCPKQVYDRIYERLSGNLRMYPIGNGTITFRSYTVDEAQPKGVHRELLFSVNSQLPSTRSHWHLPLQ